MCQAGIDPLPFGTQGPGKFGNGTGLAVAVILDFHQADDVGIKGDQGTDQLLGLAGQFCRVVCAPRRRESATHAVTVEEVQHVERSHHQVTAILKAGLGYTCICLAEGRARGRLQTPFRKTVVENAGKILNGVASAHGLAGAQLRCRVGHDGRVLAVTGVVQDNPVQRIQISHQCGIRSGLSDTGGDKVATAPEGQAAVTAQVVVVVHHKRRAELYPHGFKGFRSSGIGPGQGDLRRRWKLRITTVFGTAQVGQFGQAVVFGHFTGKPQALAGLGVQSWRIDKQAFGGCRVVVAV